jgi:hypothetical protein
MARKTTEPIKILLGEAMTNLLQYLSHPSLPSLEGFSFIVNIYAVILSLIGVVFSTRKIVHFWRTRHLQKVWGIKNGDNVIVVCSELSNPEERQYVKEEGENDVPIEKRREFIYNLKYGDVDAYFEVIVTLIRLFPKIKLRILSSGEAEKTRMDLAQHLILIGGPDYNAFTKKVLGEGVTQFGYRSVELNEKSKTCPEEIVIYETAGGQEYCEFTNEKDYGYFERIKNPRDPLKNIILIGGCHTIGVTGAAKAFSMFSEQGETPRVVLQNARSVAKKISRDSEFVVLIRAERFGQTINTPIVDARIIKLKSPKRG